MCTSRTRIRQFPGGGNHHTGTDRPKIIRPVASPLLHAVGQEWFRLLLLVLTCVVRGNCLNISVSVVIESVQPFLFIFLIVSRPQAPFMSPGTEPSTAGGAGTHLSRTRTPLGGRGEVVDGADSALWVTSQRRTQSSCHEGRVGRSGGLRRGGGEPFATQGWWDWGTQSPHFLPLRGTELRVPGR